MSKKPQINDQELRFQGRGAVLRADKSEASPWHLSDAITGSPKTTSTEAWLRTGISLVRQHPATTLLSACAIGSLVGFACGYFIRPPADS
jgi:hypothetical protein